MCETEPKKANPKEKANLLSLITFLHFCIFAHLPTTDRKASINLHKAMIAMIINARMSFFDSNLIGNVLNRFSKDLCIDEHLPFVMSECFELLFVLGGIIFLVASVNPYFLIPAGIFSIIAYFARFIYLRTGRSLQRLEAASNFTFDLLKRGYSRDLTYTDIYKVLPKLKASKLGDKLERKWSGTTHSIYSLLWKCYGKYYLFLGLIQLLVKLFMITVLPSVQGKLISYFTSSSKLTKSDAAYYAFVMIVSNFIICTYNHNYRFLITELGIEIKTAFCSLIYRKVLRVSSQSLSENGVGNIVTLLSKDVNNFEDVIIFLNDVWISFIIVVVACYVMYAKIGLAALTGILLILVIIPIQVYLAKLTTNLRIKAAKATDNRIQIIGEALSSIKLVKIQNWEDYFIEKISDSRSKEMGKIKKCFFIKSAFIETGTFIVTLTWYILVVTYTQLGYILTAEIAFFLKECLQVLRSPITISIPLGILRSAEIIASIHRLHKLLKSEEALKRKTVTSDEAYIQIENGIVRLENNQKLTNINLRIEPGLTIVSGKHNVGKSCFLKAIIESMDDSFTIHGTISYASQSPWLFPASIKQNILLGEELNEKRYQQVLKVCALYPDIENFKKGDATIIDDGGRNLSKGQQFRIHLARTIYRRSEIYIIDDCFSSLDVFVQDYIFQNCILDFLKDKIVIIISNNERFFQNANKLLIVDDGTVKICKTFQLSEVNDNHSMIDKQPTELISSVNKNYNIYRETNKKGKVDYKSYKKYCEFGGGWLFLLWIFILYIATQTGLSFSEKGMSKWVNIQQTISEYSINSNDTKQFDRFKEQNEDSLNFYSLAIAFSIIFILIRTSVYFFFVIKAAVNLHKTMLITVINVSMNFFDSHYFGNIVNRFARDFLIVDEILPFNVHEFIKISCKLLSIIILIVSVNSHFIIPSLIFFFVLFFLRKFYIPTGRSLMRLNSANRSPLIGHLNATLDGLTTIQASGIENILKQEFDSYQDVYTSVTYMNQSTSRAFAYVLDMFCNCFVTIVVLRFLIVDKDTQAGNVGLAITQALSLRGLIQFGIRQSAEFETNMTSVERVLEYANSEKENKSGHQLESLPTAAKIIYKNVKLKYNNSKRQVLNDINFCVNLGEKIGIVGTTGAGKSSLALTLFRLYTYEGMITINDFDIKRISLDYLRSNLTYICQDPLILNETLRTNLNVKRLCRDEEIWNVMDKIGLKSTIPDLDYQILENGKYLSSSQKLLICLARALLNKTKILILDEATVNVDPEMEAELLRILKEYFSKSTIFIITHNMQTVYCCDRIIVLDKGEIVEFDQVNILMRQEDSIFYKMYQKVNHTNC